MEQKQLPRSRAGFSLIEVAISVICLAVLMGGAATALVHIENVYAETESAARITLRAERALSRLNEILRQAVTTDSSFGLVEEQGRDAAGVSFRLLESVADAELSYDSLNVFIVGPNEGASPCRGLVVARAGTLAAAHGVGAGDDGILGTTDDDTKTSAGTLVPAVEMLIPDTFAPREGEMFVLQQPTPGSRMLTITLRMNLRQPNGDFLLGEDFVITEGIALRQ